MARLWEKVLPQCWNFISVFWRRKAEADFIKIMTTGFWILMHMEPLPEHLWMVRVKEMVHIAHEEGMAVMSHTNGDYGVQAAVAAGVDSLEHGNYMNEESLAMLARVIQSGSDSGYSTKSSGRRTL